MYAATEGRKRLEEAFVVKNHGKQSATVPNLIDDKRFRDLLRTSQRKALTWDSFLNHSLPENMSPHDAWEALESVNRCLGVHLFESQKDDLLWYRRTYELESIAYVLISGAAQGSDLHRYLEEPSSKEFVEALRLREFTSSFVRSGRSLKEDDLVLNASLGLEPQRPLERLALNAMNIDADLARYDDVPFSPDLLEELEQRLMEGVDADGLGDDPLRPFPMPSGGPRSVDAHVYVERVMEYAREGEAHGEELRALRGAIIGDALRASQINGIVSAPLASLVARISYRKEGLPVLAMLPTSEMLLRWAQGQIASLSSEYRLEEQERTHRHAPSDLTLWCTVVAACMSEALEEVSAASATSTTKQSKLWEALQSDSRFNRRQRAVLSRILQAPGAEVYILQHQRRYEISYATARRDLVELERLGLLRSEQRGKAFVYMAGDAAEDYLIQR